MRPGSTARLAETTLTNSTTSARALQTLIALTDREHFVALFVNGNHQITGAHIVAIGAQHTIASVDTRALFRAALAACSSGVVVGHNHPGGEPSRPLREQALDVYVEYDE